MTLKGWYSAMESTSRRRMVLSNLIYDLTSSRPDGSRRAPEASIRSVVRRVEAVWKDLTDRHATAGVAPERLLIEAVAEVIPHILCGGPPIDPKKAKLARVTGAVGWYENTVDAGVHGMPKRDEIPDHILRDIEKNGLQPDQIKPNAQVRGEWPEAWVTRAEDLDQFVAKCTDHEMLAARIRDFLGLIHYDDDQQLVRLDYPDDALGSEHLSAPTFLDGCGTRVYRSVTRDDEWGRTVDLSNAGEGAPEAVHPPIPYTSKFEMTYLERIAGRTHAFVYRDLVKNCPRPWQSNDDQQVEELL